MWCSCHKITAHSDADCLARRRKWADGNAHIAATGPPHVKGFCSAYDLPGEEDQPERTYISFTPTEVHPAVVIAAGQSYKAETWPFGSLSASRPRLFEERAKAAIPFEGQQKPDLSYMYGETDCEGDPLYEMALMESEPAETEHNTPVRQCCYCPRRQPSLTPILRRS